MYTEAQG